jgi:hypothetical protein
MPRRRVTVQDKLNKELAKGGEVVKLEELIADINKLGVNEEQPAKLKTGSAIDMKYVDIATRLAASGLTETDIAYILGVKFKDIQRWKRNTPLFKTGLENGRRLSKSFLIAQGLKAAAGYNYVETNVKFKTKVLEDGTTVRYPAEVSEFHKHQASNPQLLMFMLCNLSRQLGDEEEHTWVSQHKMQINSEKNIKVTIDGNLASKQINNLAGKILEQERKKIESKVVKNE